VACGSRPGLITFLIISSCKETAKDILEMTIEREEEEEEEEGRETEVDY
jgi:hypothetical protein